MHDFNINFIVHSPLPEYVNYIGGIMVCHSLANDLVQLGETAYVYANSTKADYKCSIIPYNTDISYEKENTIIIYTAGADHVFSDYIPRNIIQIPNVVRWLIGYQQYPYSPNDKFYKYCQFFTSYETQKVDGEFLSYDVDHNLFSDKKLERSGYCFYTKGNSIKNIYHPSDALSLDNIYTIEVNKRMHYLSHIFNIKKYFICYTHTSFIAVLAALCGCIVIVIPRTYTGIEIPTTLENKKMWRDTLPTFKYGIAFGMDDIEYATNTTAMVEDNIKNIKKQGIENISKFVDNCYDWLKNKYNL